MGATIGGATVVVAAFIVSTFQPEPTIIDRFLPLVVLSVWWLAHAGTNDQARELGTLLVPLILAAAVAVAATDLRLLIYGGALAVVTGLHVWGAEGGGRVREVLTAAALVAPMRIVDATSREILVQAVFVAGSAALWIVLRRTQSPPVVAALVLLVAVSVPAVPGKLAFVPLGLAGLAWALQRHSWAVGATVVVLTFFVARWLAAVVALTIVVSLGLRWWYGRRGLSAVALPLMPGPPNLPALLLPAAFLPSTLVTVQGVATFLAAVGLAAVVRPSLAAPLVVAGLVAGAAATRRDAEASAGFELPPLVLAGTILMFFPWSGAILPRPPAPLPAMVVLAIASLALLPAVFRSWTGLPALAIALLAASGVVPRTEPLAHPGRQLVSAQSLAIPIPSALEAERLEVTIAGVNLETALLGREVAVIELLDRDGRGFRRRVRLGEIADWGAFRPPLVLRTSNQRPDRLNGIEGHGLGASVSGAGTIVLEPEWFPRALVITASRDLTPGEEIIVEEVRYR